MAHYDAAKMRNGANEIRAELRNYQAAKQEIDNIVSMLRQNWEDDNNTEYAQKYNREAKVSAENVQRLMETFATMLESSGESWDRVYGNARTSIGS